MGRLVIPNYDAAPEPEPTPPPPAPTMPPWAPPPQVATPMSMSAAEPEPEKPPQPAMAGLGAVANTDKFREQINAEGWDLESPPQFDVPGQNAISPASRALASLVGERGRAY